MSPSYGNVSESRRLGLGLMGTCVDARRPDRRDQGGRRTSDDAEQRDPRSDRFDMARPRHPSGHGPPIRVLPHGLGLVLFLTDPQDPRTGLHPGRERRVESEDKDDGYQRDEVQHGTAEHPHV